MEVARIKNWMRQHKHLYRCERTGSLNHTRLAEEAATTFNLYLEGSYNIPDAIFEIAQEFE